MLRGIQMNIGHLRVFLGQRDHLEIVGREQGHGAKLPSQMLGCSPGQRQPIEGAGAAADFVHQYQAAGRGMVQDVRRLRHLHHEGRPAAGQVVRCPDAGEYPVDRADHGLFRRDETADVGHQHDHGGLSHVGRFAAHVGTGNDQHAPFRTEFQIVRHEGSIEHAFNHRVPAGRDPDTGNVGQPGPHKAEAGGALGQVGQHVQFRQSLRCVLQRMKMAAQPLQQRLVQGLLMRQRAFAGAQHLVLECLQFRSDVALDPLEGLASHVVDGYPIRLGAR